MIKVPKAIQRLFSSALWNMGDKEKVIYLTFDDGPTPFVTEQVIELLEQYNAKATFFCIGNNVAQYPTVYKKVEAKGHKVGNHTYHHLKGLKTSNKPFYNDIEQAAQLIQTNLFRPPYGKMKWSQYLKLKKEYKVVLWDVIPGDFKKNMTISKLVQNVVNNVSKGSIVVLHDSEKCAKVMLAALPIILEQLTKKGFTFKAIEDYA